MKKTTQMCKAKNISTNNKDCKYKALIKGLCTIHWQRKNLLYYKTN